MNKHKTVLFSAKYQYKNQQTINRIVDLTKLLFKEEDEYFSIIRLTKRKNNNAASRN